MSRQNMRLPSVRVGSMPRKRGSVPSVTSTKAVPFVLPMIAYSRPVSGSVQPQMSLPIAPPPISASDRLPSRSTSLHGNSPAMPFTQSAPAAPWAAWVDWAAAARSRSFWSSALNQPE
jgi:hypothetical protein